MERIAEEIGSFDHIELVVCTSPMQSSKFANFARIKKTLQGRFRYQNIFAKHKSITTTQKV